MNIFHNLQFSTRRLLSLLMALNVFIAGICTAQTTPPDLKAAGVIAALKTDPNATPVYGETYNLGATGLRGWIYIGGGTPFDGTLTVNSRQILVTVASTPGSAVLAVDDVILGAMAGSTGTVPAFTSDARKAFGAAITNAEKTGAGSLRVKRWRAGTTTDVNIAMTIMGDYSNTAPYTCPKSALIRANARNKLVAQLLADSNFLSVDYAGAINGLALMAGVAPGDPDYATVQTRLQTFARTCASTTPPSEGGSTWHLGYVGLFLAEYYLLTNDTQVVSGLNNYTVTLAQMQSRYGTFGHSGSIRKADGSLHGTIPPYGPVNSAGIPANIAIVMGKKALLAAGQAIDPEIDPAIQRGSDFFGWYVNKGGIPYGEHEPGSNAHSVGGKDQMCAVLFGLQADRTVEAEYFSRLSIAGFDGREYGHAGGQNFSFLWHAMGAHMGGELALAEYTKQIRWHLDMVRRTDGSFAFEGQEQFGAGSTADGTYLGASNGYDFQTTASYLLTYSLPLKRLYITGKNAIPANTLDASKVANAIAAATFNRDASTFTTTQLIAGLSEFDPVVRNAAAVELAKRSVSAGELTTLRGMVTGADANGRMGACQTLGLLKDVTALPLIAQRLDKNIETNSWVRGKAANAIRQYDSAAASTYRDPALTAFAANATDPEVIDWNDPLQRANTQLSFCLFGGWDETQNAVPPFDTISAPKNLLYPAVKAGLKQPDSLPRAGVANFSYNGLTLPDVQALIPDLIEVAAVESQADTMWSADSRAAGINTLAKWNISEAIPVALAMQEIPEGFGWGADGFLVPGLNALAAYGDAARWTLPTLKGYLATWDPAASRFTTLVNTIATIENAITAPTLIPGLAVANSQVVATTGAKAITLTGTSPRSAVTFTNVTQPANGTLTGTAPNLTYTPSAGYTGTDKFTFQVVDSLTTSEPGTVSIIVGSAAGTGITGTYFDNIDFTNQKGTRTDSQINFDWGTTTPSGSGLTGGNTFSVRWSGQLRVPETGTYTFSTLNSDGARVYVNGQMVLDDYLVQTTNWTDGSPINLTAGQLVDLQMLYYENTGSAVAKLKWTGPSFSGPNGNIIGSQWLYNSTTLTPYAHAQTITMVKDTSKLISLTGSGSTLTYAVVTPPAQGTLTGTAPNLTYTPPAGFSGSVSFTFRVNNGTTDSAPATVSINVQSGTLTAYTWASAVSGNWNDGTKWTPSLPATAGLAHYALNFTTSGTYTATQDLSNGFQLNQLNTAANVTLAGTNSVSFVANGGSLPQFNQNGPDTVTVTHPISLQAMTSVGGSGSGTVSLTGTISGSGGIIKNNYGTLSIDQNNTYSGGTIINVGTLAIGGEMNGALGTGPVTLNGGTLFLGRINAANPLTVSGGKILSDGGWGNSWNGPVTLNGNLTVDVPYYDRMFFSGNISGVGGLIIQANSTNPDHAVNLSGTNTYSGRTSVKTGQLTCTASAALGSGVLDIASGAKVNLNYTGSRTIASLTLGGTVMPPGTYGSTASPATHKNDAYFDGTGTVTVSNNAPVAVPQSVSTSKNTQTLITFAGTDAENSPLTYQIVSQPAHGTLSGTAPNVTYTPALGFYGADSFSFRVNDGTIDSAVATVSITVTQFPNDPPPVISTLNPADEATGVAVGANLVATFSENIVIGTGNITVRNLTDGTQTTIAVTDTTQVSISGAVLTINPTANLAANKNYAVQIAATAIDDTAGNSFAGITNDATWNFATPDTIAPVISSFSPADNVTAVAVGTNLVATFSEPIAIGTGDITVRNVTDGTQTTIAVTDTTQVSVSGNVLTINPTANLAANKNYAVQIAATAIDDTAGNSFAGITNDATWNFATPDTIAPVISSLNPENNATGVSVGANLVVTFSENIVAGTGNITLKNLSGATQTTIAITDTTQVSISGAVLTVNPTADLAADKNYAVQIAATAIDDTAGNSFAGITDDATWNFATPDTIAPVISSFSPADEATGVAVGANFVATFSENIVIGTGDITVRNLTDGTQTTIAVTDTTQVSISGNVLTINPTADLLLGKNYAVRIAATSIDDTAGNSFAGFTDDTTWNFATAAPDTTAPTITSYSPADNATGVAVGANFVATFSENIVRGTGNITVRNVSDATSVTIAVTDNTQITISGNVLTINPTANLLPSKNYAIRIAATCIDDTAGNGYAGIINNNTTWNFATAAPDTTAPTITNRNPADNATGVAVGANLVATFSENIAIGTGNITLRKLSDNTDTNIAVTDATQVSISGNVLTINPTANLLPNTSYAVLIAATCIDDTAGNSFAGIANNTNWNFSTQADETSPDSMNLNFYSYGSLTAANYNTATLEAGESAGVGDYNLTGWQNYEVPWGLDAPADPFTLTSNLGATATMTLNDVRNGGTDNDQPNPDLGGSGDLMDGLANGTEDPYDESAKFDMTVSNIPYSVYDLIVYISGNGGVEGDGTGKLILNGGTVTNFTVALPFNGFAEITNGTTPGNYIIFRKLRTPSLTLKVWGNGFNHIGPAGFQIVKDTSGILPPTPASTPNPPDTTLGHAFDTNLSWTAGADAVSRNIYFGTNPSPGASELRGNQTATTFDPGALANGTYYWRIDEVNGDGATTGPVWSFSVGPPAKAFRPMPWNGLKAVATNVGTLKWVAGKSATASSHDVYFGTDSTPDSSEFIGNQTGTTFNPGTLSRGTTYYWRIDQVNAQGTMTGDVWSFTTPSSSANKVKVFILAGQSNMVGQGEINPVGTPGTLEYTYNNDQATYAHLKNGSNWAVRDDAWIWYNRDGTLVKGGLTTGYGVDANNIGPELQFGHAMGQHYGQKVLLIKTAWGGKSLQTDFRPPSAGWDLDVPAKAGDKGYYFTETLKDVLDATANLQTHFPDYNPADGFEIVGCAWHQGWNDFVSTSASAEYEANMENFIKDLRLAVGVPNLPFVIATTGQSDPATYSEVELAQLEMEDFTKYPAFNGNVAVVDAKAFWIPVSASPADQGYHWNRNAKTYYMIGNALAQETLALIQAAGPATPYDAWLDNYTFASGADITPTGDPDGDGMNNQEEFAFGLDPTRGASANPITQQLDKNTGIFKYTRTKDSGLIYKIYSSTDLSAWTLDASATQSPAAAVAGVETVTVTLAAATPPDGKRFVRVEATPAP